MAKAVPRIMCAACVEYLLLLVGVMSAIGAIGYLLPMARRERDICAAISAGVIAALAIIGCSVTAWLLLTRRVTETGIEYFFSLLFFAGFIWVVGFLLPMARREPDTFETICAVVAALVALAAWLLIGIGVQSG